MGIAIAKKLTDAGYQMLGDDESIEELILTILKDKNTRYLKALPFLLYKYPIDTTKLFIKTKEKELLTILLGMTSKSLVHEAAERALATGRLARECRLMANTLPRR